jgi:hypothetical protein
MAFGLCLVESREPDGQFVLAHIYFEEVPHGESGNASVWSLQTTVATSVNDIQLGAGASLLEGEACFIEVERLSERGGTIAIEVACKEVLTVAL